MKGSSSNNSQNQDSGCKIFVGGLTWNTTKEMLYNEFSKYGEIVDSIVMKNPETGNSRGFGFVTYKENQSAETAVATGSHRVDGKIVDVKLCNPRLAAQQRNIKQKIDNCKVFVGGLPHGVTDDQIKQFFARYGPVKEFKMMYDENKQRPRGFGFITFDTEESANQVLQEHYIQFSGKQIEVKPQIHNLKQQLPYQQQQQMQFQQAHFSSGNWNSQWNQGQIPQPSQAMGNPNGPNYGSVMPQGYNAPMNSALVNPQWGYPGSQQSYGNTGPNNPQSNWNYQYYGQPQPGYYQQADSSATGLSSLSVPPQDSQLHSTPDQHHQPQTQPPVDLQPQQSIITTTTDNLTQPFAHSKNPKLLLESKILTSDYLQDSAFLPNASYKQSSSSSIAGTIGSNANYSDSETSSHSYYRGNSIGSNSSIAPSISSLTGSSMVSNISGNSSNSSSSTTSSNSQGLSNHNHHRINTNAVAVINDHRNFRHNNRSGGSVASSSATDVSSVHSSMVSSCQMNSEEFSGQLNDENYYQGQHRQGSLYHPYRR